MQREAYHTSPSSIKVRNAFSYISIPHASSLCGAQISTGASLLERILLSDNVSITVAIQRGV